MGWFSKNDNSLKRGDWVTSYSKGIFRIETVVQEYYDAADALAGEHNIGLPREQKTVIVKRLLNARFKKSIGYETCSASFISPLNREEQQQLDMMIRQDPGLIRELDDYQIPDIESIYNMPLQVDTADDLEKVQQLQAFIRAGKTFQEIEEEMQRQDMVSLKPKFFGNRILQLINFNFEINSARQNVWREANLIEG